jgi:dihydroorotate dehydrogenase (NAD+) catalytic subunit
MSVVPVFAKLPALSADLVEVAHAVVRAGARGVTVLDPPPAVSVDAARLRPALGSVSGWLSGPAIAPLARHAVLAIARALPDVPILACGGVRTGTDAVELMLAGAWAVQVGTATLVDPAVPVEVARGVAAYLKDKGLRSPADIRGRLRVPSAAGPP